MRQALEGLEGVKKANVSFWRGKTEVEFERGKVTIEQMMEAIEKAGYKASLLQSPGEKGRE